MDRERDTQAFVGVGMAEAGTPGMSPTEGGTPAAAPSPAPGREGGQGAGERAKLPGRAALLAAAGVVAGLALSVIGSTIAVLAAPGNKLALMLLSLGGLWTGLLGAVWTASRKFGSGNVWRDFGVRLPASDIGRGLVVAVVGRVAGLILVVPLISISRRFIGSDLKPFEGARTDPVLLAVVAALVLVGAPFVEELFFRGLLLRSLLPLLGPRGAIAAQALVFASLHLRPSYGLGNVSLVLAIGTMGIVQGIVAERYRRLGPVMVAHSLFNLPGLLAIATR